MGLSKAYLIAYNVSQFCGWTYLMYRLMPYLTLQAKTTLSFPGTGNETSQIPLFPANNPASLYAELGDHVKLVQTAAILEVVHAAIGIVRSNPMTCAVQIARYVYYAGNALERVQRVHEPADLQEITF